MLQCPLRKISIGYLTHLVTSPQNNMPSDLQQNELTFDQSKGYQAKELDAPYV